MTLAVEKVTNNMDIMTCRVRMRGKQGRGQDKTRASVSHV